MNFMLKGHPVKIGIYQGRLTQDLIKKQETIFVDMLNRFVPVSIQDL